MPDIDSIDIQALFSRKDIRNPLVEEQDVETKRPLGL
jgi:hypothetical protein